MLFIETYRLSIGSRDGRVCIWDLTPPEGLEKIPHPVAPPGGYLPPIVPTFNPCNELNEEKSGGPTRVVAFSPKYMVFATAGDTLVCHGRGSPRP